MTPRVLPTRKVPIPVARQSLYRKYRPQTFDDVVGQQHVTRTLRNAVAEGTIAHAYLFTGPRGTGKTTSARILAKALDCVKGPTPDPDLTCESCVDIAEGRHPDVHELDAASRTGVDAVREEIIGRVNYASTRGKHKVYVIDEVHMLSSSAFNALLKTLEEPPSHTVFVLCTTHPQKVPETIHSRCQRFDFHRLGAEDIVTRLTEIASAEEIKVAEGALTLIARHAGGGMRDAISTLDQLASFTANDITLDEVEGLLGEVASSVLFEVADVVVARDVAGCFRLVAQLAESGVDVPEFVRELVGHFRDLYVTMAAGDPTGLVDATNEDVAKLVRQSREYGPERLARSLELLGRLESDLRWAADPRLSLEVALVRLTRPQGELTLEALDERLAALEAAAGAGATGAPAIGTSDRSSAASAQPASRSVVASDAQRSPSPPPRPAPTPSTPPSASSSGASASARPAAAGDSPKDPPPPRAALDRAKARRAWPLAIAEFKKLKPTRSQLFNGAEVDVDGDELVVEFPPDAAVPLELAGEQETLEALRRALQAVLGVQPVVRYQLGRGSIQPRRAKVPVSTVPTPPSEENHAEERPEGGAAEAETGSLERMLIDELGAEVVEEHRLKDEEGQA